jgi:phage-related protein
VIDVAAEDISGKLGLDTTDWKTGVSQLNRDVRTIESGFKAVAAGMDDWTKSADGLKARNSALSDVIAKQKEKVSLLEGEYGRLKDEAEANGDTTERTAAAMQEFEIKINKAKEQLAKSETELRKNTEALDGMESGSDDAGKATGELAEKEKKAEKEGKSFAETLKSAGAYISKGFVAAAKAAAAAVAAVGTAIGAAAKKAFDFATGAGEMADNVKTLSDQTGISTGKLQEWEYASNFVDVSVDTMTGSMAKMIKQMGSGNKAFDTLGVSIRDSNGNLRDSEDVFADAIDALGGISNETERDALSMELFGKSAQDLNPLIKAGGDALKQYGEEAKTMGTVFDENAIAAMGSFDDSMQRAKATASGLKNAIGLTLIPAFQPLVDTAANAMAQVSTALQDGLQPGELETIMAGVLATISDMVGQIMNLFVSAMPYIIDGINVIVTQLVAYLPSLIETILPAAFSLLQSLVDAITQNIDPLVACALTLVTMLAQFIIENIPTLVAAATDIINGLVDGLIAVLPSLIPAAIQMMVQLALALVQAIPEITAKLPEIIDAIINGLTQVDWAATGTAILQGVITGLLSLGETLRTTAVDLGNRIWNAITGIDWASLGTNLINGVVNGMGSLVDSVKEKVTGFFSTIWGGVKDFFGIHSPSTVAADDGRNLMQGFQNGAEQAQPSVLDKVKGVFKGIWDGIKSIFGFGGNNESAEAEQTGKDVTQAVADGISGGGESAKQSAKSVSETIVTMFQTELGINGGTSTKTNPFGIAAVQGLKDGFTNGLATAITKAAEIATAMLTALQRTLGLTGSTSTVTLGYGQSVVQGAIDGLAGMVTSVTNEAKTVGDAIATGIAQGIRNGASAITDAARIAAARALAAAKKLLGIASPSKVAAKELGLPFVQGIAKGMTANVGVIAESMKGVTTGLMDSAKAMNPVSLPAGTEATSGTTIVSAVLQVGERQFGNLIVELADAGQGFAAANRQRLNMGVQIV